MNTKTRIVVTADSLFYQQGFEHTSFADISKVVGISRGNFYHHFKTKDQILGAVIERRLAKTQQRLEEWEKEQATPLDRIKCYFSIFTVDRDEIKMYGCPTGSLSAEMTKLNHPLTDDSVRIYTLFRQWISAQFELLNYSSEKADALAMHVLSISQGIAVVFNAFKDEEFVVRELELAFQWLDGLALNNN